jgi:hypothetical protein
MSEQKKIREEYVLDEDLRWRLEKSDMGQENPRKKNDDEERRQEQP